MSQVAYPSQKRKLKIILVILCLLAIPIALILPISIKRAHAIQAYHKQTKIAIDQGSAATLLDLDRYNTPADAMRQEELWDILYEADTWAAIESPIYVDGVLDLDKRSEIDDPAFSLHIDKLKHLLDSGHLNCSSIAWLKHDIKSGKELLYNDYQSIRHPQKSALLNISNYLALALHKPSNDKQIQIDHILKWRDLINNPYTYQHTMDNMASLQSLDLALLHEVWNSSRDHAYKCRLTIKHPLSLIRQIFEGERLCTIAARAQLLSEEPLALARGNPWSYLSVYSSGYSDCAANIAEFNTALDIFNGTNKESLASIKRQFHSRVGYTTPGVHVIMSSLCDSHAQQRCCAIAMEICHHFKAHNSIPGDQHALTRVLPQCAKL